MKTMVRVLSLLALLLAPNCHGQLARQVDPFLGVEAGGNVFPGPAMPFGMIKPGPDMVATGQNDANAGWDPHGDIRGFSQTHVSGTGGGPKYGNILVMPSVGAPTPLDAQSPRQNERASVGYYGVTLARSGIRVEITAARRAAIYRVIYPAGAPANLLFDVSHCLVASPTHGESQSVTASDVRVLSPTEVGGSSSVTGGWNKQPNSYTVYFYAITNTPAISWGTWVNGQLSPANKQAHGQAGEKAGAWLSFAPRSAQPVLMKIGISFVSVEQAKQNAAREIPGFDFDATQAAAVAAWEQALRNVELQGETAAQAQVFYTALYHTMLAPVDRSALLLAKELTLLCYLVVLELVAVPAFALLLSVPFAHALPDLLLVLLLADLGVAVVGTLVAALAVQTRARDLLGPLLGLPLLVPIVIGAARASSPLLVAGHAGPPAARWLAMLALYDLIFGLIAYAVFDFLLED